jgi:hypothetical protein
MAKQTKPVSGCEPNNTLQIEQTPDETGAQAMARNLLEPHIRHAVTASTYAEKVLGRDVVKPGAMDFADHVRKITGKAEAGDLAIASRLLAAQAVTLDSMFTELARRVAINMGEYINAAEQYGRLALKAQGNCRATLETLVRLHQPREQTVRHVHVNEGGQAVIADQFHHHTGAAENGKPVKQSHATGPTGTGAALPSPDTQGATVPIPSSERQAALQNARRYESGRA